MEENITLKCCDCGTDIIIPYKRYKKRKKGRQFRCKKCLSELLSKRKKEMWDNFSPERREQISQNMSSAQFKYINSLDEEGMKKYKERQSNSAKKLWDNLSEDEYVAFKEKISACSKEMWANKSEEERREIAKKIAAGRQAYWDNMPEEDRIAFGIQHKKWWDTLVGEEREKQMEPMRQGFLKWYHNLPKEEKDRIAKIKGECSQRFWDSMSDKDKEEWMIKRNEGFEKYYQSINVDPNKNERSFIDYLNIDKIPYTYQYFTKTKHPDFDKLFPSNPVTGASIVSPYHSWDFKISTLEGDMLIDIDGSIHNLGENSYTVKIYTGKRVDVKAINDFNDSQRPYKTDGLPAYIVQCYDDNMTLNTPVVDVNGKNKMTLKAFLALVKWKNMTDKEKNEITKNI